MASGLCESFNAKSPDIRCWKLTRETNGILIIAATACRKGASAALQIAASTKEDLENPHWASACKPNQNVITS